MVVLGIIDPILTVIHGIVDPIPTIILGIIDPIPKDTEGGHILHEEGEVFRPEGDNFFIYFYFYFFFNF
jgi:hypothetical protein